MHLNSLGYVDRHGYSYLFCGRLMQCLLDRQLCLFGYNLLIDCCVIDVFGLYVLSVVLTSLLLLQTLELIVFTTYMYASLGLYGKNFTVLHWISREIYDYFGVLFFTRLDVRRLFTDYFCVGFPLRKNYPLCGVLEVYYNSNYSSVSYFSIESIATYRLALLNKNW